MKRKIMAVLSALCILLLCGCGTPVKEAAAEQPKTEVSALIGADGTAHFVYDEGKVFSVPGDAYDGKMTKDRKHCVVLDQDGTLSEVSVSDGTKKAIDTGVRWINAIRDDGVVYERRILDGAALQPGQSYDGTPEDFLGVYNFGSGQKFVSDRPYHSCSIADDNCTLLYIVDEAKGSLYEYYAVYSGKTSAERVESSKKYLVPLDINADGSCYALKDDDGFVLVKGDQKLYITADGQSLTFNRNEGLDAVLSSSTKGNNGTGENEQTSWTGYWTFNKEFTYAVGQAYNDSADKDFVMWSADGGIVRAKAPEDKSSIFYSLLTDSGYFDHSYEGKPECLYLRTYPDMEYYNLYTIFSDGSRDKLVGYMKQVQIVPGYLYAINQDAELYRYKLENGLISEEQKIAGDVAVFTVTESGSIAYIRNASYESWSTTLGTLYLYDPSYKKPKKVNAEAVSTWWSNVGAFSPDGKYLYYYTNPETKDSWDIYGTLMKYDISAGESARIGSEVYAGPQFDIVRSNGILFKKYAYKNEQTDKTYYDLCYYDGETVEVIVKEVQ